MKHTLRVTTVFLALNAALAFARAQDTPVPKPDDAENMRFKLRQPGKPDASSGPGQSRSDANPESRLDDAPPANDKVTPTNRPGKQ